MSVVCSECGGASTVTTTNRVGQRNKRYRRCLACGHRWSTVEVSKEDFERVKWAERVYDQLRTRAEDVLRLRMQERIKGKQ